jgi:LPXTG-motif cell wall-anchored protein
MGADPRFGLADPLLTTLAVVKEFWIYTGLRILLLVASVAVVFGTWLAIAGSAPIMWVLLIGLVLSGFGSYFLLRRQRVALAQHVDERARRATERFEEMRAKEDVD